MTFRSVFLRFRSFAFSRDLRSRPWSSFWSRRIVNSFRSNLDARFIVVLFRRPLEDSFNRASSARRRRRTFKRFLVADLFLNNFRRLDTGANESLILLIDYIVLLACERKTDHIPGHLAHLSGAYREIRPGPLGHKYSCRHTNHTQQRPHRFHTTCAHHKDS